MTNEEYYEYFVAFQENLMLLYVCFRFSEVMDQLFLTVRGVVQGSFMATLGVASVFTTRMESLKMFPHHHHLGFFFRC